MPLCSIASGLIATGEESRWRPVGGSPIEPAPEREPTSRARSESRGHLGGNATGLFYILEYSECPFNQFTKIGGESEKRFLAELFEANKFERFG